MKSFKLLTVFIAFSIFATSTFAMNDATYLRKLSLSIRGVPPKAQDYKDLAGSSDKQAFIKTKIKEYLSSKEHRDKMIYRLSELFQIRAQSQAMWRAENEEVSYRTPRWDSLTDLFARLATQNLSWDSLLTSKTYNLFNYPYEFSASDYGVFGTLEPELLKFGTFGVIVPEHVGTKDPNEMDPEGSGDDKEGRMGTYTPYKLALPADDLRVAGSVTTTRFLARNTNTGVNKNRRRAAAIYRMFLCDPMIPAIESGKDRTHDFHDVAFAETYEVTEQQIKDGILKVADKHGSDAQCLACHYKLDPLGKIFQNIGVVLSAKASPGALIFKRADNTVVNEPLRGIGDLGNAMTKQAEYASCQVSWFWKAFIGEDVQLTKAKREELVTKFDAVGRRTNDFIEYLVSTNEFITPPVKSEVITFTKVEPLLKRCDSCHDSDIPSFATLPIGFSGSQTEHESWIANMLERTHRPEGTKGRMPKDAAKNWTTAELETVKQWLTQGAPDENGKPTAPVTGGQR